MSYPNDPSGPQPPYGGPPGQPPYGPTGGQPSYGPPGGQPPYGDSTGGYQSYGAPGGQPPYDPYGATGAPQQKKGMSTGAKVGIGVGAGCLGLIVIVVVIIVVIAMASGGDDTSVSSAPTSSQTTEPGTPDEEAPAEAPAEGVGLTATSAGTVGGTLDPNEVYTVLDVTFVNNSGEPLPLNPLYFTYILDDGTEVVDWELFADIPMMEATDLAPGEQFTGQVAVAGEVTVAEVHYDPYFGMEDPIVAPVQ
ncbi:hypothetical protein SUDANB121_02489 [Nocardiopsis dassonvillei]|uniref:DUF4352 domain-containing protein n=1 Tax=Nocardiopsis dassonvillei TaxID=2014 RepID=UPI003F5667EF